MDITKALEFPIMTTTVPLGENEDTGFLTNPELIYEKFGKIVDLVIDGGTGDYSASTIVDCTGDYVEIARQGKGELMV